MRARTCSSSIPTSASIAAFANQSPVDAIKPDTEPGLEKWLEINAKYAQVWPNITIKREPPPDAKDWRKPTRPTCFRPILAQVIESWTETNIFTRLVAK